MEENKLNTLQLNLKLFLDNIMDEHPIKNYYFTINKATYQTILNNCFINLKQENEDTESCVDIYMNKLKSIELDTKQVFSNQNKKLAECVNRCNSSTKDSDKLINCYSICEFEFKKNYKSEILDILNKEVNNFKL